MIYQCFLILTLCVFQLTDSGQVDQKDSWAIPPRNDRSPSRVVPLWRDTELGLFRVLPDVIQTNMIKRVPNCYFLYYLFFLYLLIILNIDENTTLDSEVEILYRCTEGRMYYSLVHVYIRPWWIVSALELKMNCNECTWKVWMHDKMLFISTDSVDI